MSENLVVMKNSYCAYGTGIGLSSYLLRVLTKMSEIYPTKVYIDWTDVLPYQNPGECKNIWDILYKQPDVEIIDDTYSISVQDSFNEWASVTKFGLPLVKTAEARAYASKIVAEKFRLKDDMKEIIDSFYEKNLSDKKCLAVHRRGCWYAGMSPMPNDVFNEMILDIYKSNGYNCVFLCSDNIPSKTNAIEFLQKNDIETFVYDSHIAETITSFGRPWDDDVSIDKNLQAKEIIIEIYLMSKCHGLVRTINSGVTQFILYMNPNIIEYNLEPTRI